MLRLTDLDTYYGQAHILRGVSLKLPQGEVLGLLGRNGAGKSTTMKAIIGVVKATRGAVYYNNQNLAKLENYQRAQLGIGYVPEERRIFRRLSVIENIQAGTKPLRQRSRSPWTAKRVFKLFPKLEELQHRLGGQLSGGEQQMLTIGRSLMTNPDCLLLDEPTEGLAPIIIEQVVDAIKLLKKDGMAILLSEQNRHIALALTDRVTVLEKGQIIYNGALAALSARAHQALGW